MAKLPKLYYSLILLSLIIILTGCELRRDEGGAADPAPVSGIPPTLAPLGAETALETQAQVVPTVIDVQATATQSNLSADQAADVPSEPVAPTSEAVDLTGPTASSDTAEGLAASEGFTSPAEAPAAGESETQEAVVVDATTSEDLPIGGPVAANPPASQSDGSYDGSYSAPAYAPDGTYMVQSGDTLFSVAQRHGTTVEALIYANNLSSDVIYAGQVLTISAGDGGGYAAPVYEQPTYQQPNVAGGDGYLHVVAPGETLFSIALQYNASVDAIAEVNRIAYPYTIGVGQQLLVPSLGDYAGPPPGNYGPAPESYPSQENAYQPIPDNANLHTVTPGETLYSIAGRYGASVDAIAGINRIPYPYIIGVGQQLIIPAPGAYAGPPPPPADGFGQQPYMGYPSQAPGQGYFPAPENNYGAVPGNFQPEVDNYGNADGTHTVSPGETIYSIAGLYGLNAESLANANGLSNPNQIYVGQVLYLP